MTIRLYTTLGREIRDLDTRDPGKVGMYVCGPTVQSEPHLGHGRFAVAFDVIRRHLLWRGLDVTYVQNVTDVEDKIIAAAHEAGVPTEQLAAEMAERFDGAYRALNVLRPDIEPKATEHIDDMLAMIETLIEKGFAYPVPSGDVYFRVRKLESYGKLSGRKPDELRAGARVEVSEEKEDPLDFALWKAAKPDEPSWDAAWAPGRPGWHIECSAMSAKYLGEGFDIHGGGSDLIFPHHENEIAQSEAATGTTFARYWMHNGMVNLGGEKMSKSTGHVVDLTTAIERFGGTAVRLFYLRAHYRSPLEFSEDLLADAVASLDRILRLLERIPDVSAAEADEDAIGRFGAFMDDDFRTPEALSVLFDAVRDANRALDAGEEARRLVAAVSVMADVLGLVADRGGLEGVDVAAISGLGAELGLDAPSTEELLSVLVERRARAREERDWATGDMIRDRLSEAGILLEDTADGTRWHRR
jgi:cysteinyl-tRNA synthetase